MRAGDSLKSKGWFAALLLAATVSSGCGAERPEDVEQRRQEAAEQRLVARVDGEPVTLADYQASLASLPPFIRRSIRGETAYRRYLGDMVVFETLVLEARRRGMDSDPDVQLAVRNALVEALWQHTGAEAQDEEVDEATIRTRIEEHPERYRTPDAVTIIQAFTRDPRRARMLMAAMAIQQGGARLVGRGRRNRFHFFASRYTEVRGADPTLGPLTERDRDIVVPAELVDAALATDEEDVWVVQPPVDTPKGSYVYMVDELRPGKPMSDLEAQSRARQDILEEREQERRRSLQKELVEAAEVEILDPAYDSALDKLGQ